MAIGYPSLACSLNTAAPSDIGFETPREKTKLSVKPSNRAFRENSGIKLDKAVITSLPRTVFDSRVKLSFSELFAQYGFEGIIITNIKVTDVITHHTNGSEFSALVIGLTYA